MQMVWLGRALSKVPEALALDRFVLFGGLSSGVLVVKCPSKDSPPSPRDLPRWEHLPQGLLAAFEIGLWRSPSESSHRPRASVVEYRAKGALLPAPTAGVLGDTDEQQTYALLYG